MIKKNNVIIFILIGLILIGFGIFLLSISKTESEVDLLIQNETNNSEIPATIDINQIYSISNLVFTYDGVKTDINMLVTNISNNQTTGEEFFIVLNDYDVYLSFVIPSLFLNEETEINLEYDGKIGDIDDITFVYPFEDREQY